MSVSYGRAFLCLVILQLAYFSPVFFNGEVIFPHNNDRELASPKRVDDSLRVSNRKFSDNSSQFIPTINQHLNGRHRAWLATWTPNIQLGRPDYQRWPSKANLITHVLSFFTHNPFVLYTVLTLLIFCLTGIFCFLFLKSLDLHPLACFALAATYSLGTYHSYWITFVQFIAVRCWTFGLLWLVVEFIKRRRFVSGVGISFFVYCLLMMGRLQAVVRSGYLVIGFAVIYLLISNYKAKAKLYTALLLCAAALFGIITTAPTYLDLFINSARSARMSNVSDQFFLANLPGFENINEFMLFLHQFFDPFWFGNPIEPNYAFTFNGLSLTPLCFILFLLSFLDGQWRRLWPWQVFIAICLFATLCPPAYLFMVHYMGFHLQCSKPLGAAVIPAVVLAGSALDHILRHGMKQIKLSYVLIALSLLVSGFVASDHFQKLQWGFIAASLLMVLSTLLFVKTRSVILLFLLVATTVFIYGFNITLMRPLSHIHISSPLLERIKHETKDGTRYAWVGPSKRVLPPNQEILFGIESIHSYDSISSVNYQKLTRQLSKRGAVKYGRHFKYITDPNLNQPAFSYTGISLFLSYQELSDTLIRKVGEVNNIKLYKTLEKPILEAQLINFKKDKEKVLLEGGLFNQRRLEVQRLESWDDFLRFRVTRHEKESLLFISQQYHPQWRALDDGTKLKTVMINDFYLGVIIPAHTNTVELEFRPYARFSWIPQVIFIALGLLVMLLSIKRLFIRYSKERDQAKV
jgi:hypothetical protein